ncbi:MAG: tripartite tricarboxylate transporter permease [Proteobacteria bacterium]|nr:tripartite tricarboxylate transporter permease [Pseudomonadota bacterium]
MLALCGGVFLGLVVGILPGLGGTAGLALILPFLFGTDPSIALAMMIGLQSVTATSDTFPSVLMGIPGTASSQATVMDGFPMSKRGEAARALSAAFVSSMFGGLFGAAVLSVAVFFAIPLILAMGFGEQLMLIVLALTMIGMLTGLNPWKGLASCVLGLALAVVGPAPMTAELRLGYLDMNSGYFLDNLKLVIVGLSMFALPEIVDLLRRHWTISESGILGAKGGWIQGVKDWGQNWWLSLRCAAIGCLVGALPGLGGSVVDWIAYGHAIQTTDRKEDYGTGDVRGVIAPESANNAKEGGALIPTLLFGIPGSGSMAILLGGFVLVGIEPGVDMVTEQLDLVYVMIWSVGFANVIGAGTCVFFANKIALLTTIRYSLVAPFMFGLIFFAAFQATRHWGDLVMLMIVGTLGVYMKRFGWSRPALLIGFVLADKVEEGVYVTYTIHGFTFLQKPIVIVLLVLTILSIIAAARFKPKPPEMTEEGPHTNKLKKPQLAFYGILMAFFGLILIDALQQPQLTALYPLFVVGLSMIFMIPLGLQMIRGTEPGTQFYDSERLVIDTQQGEKSAEHYILWLLGMVLASAVFGFEIGVVGFIYLFVREKAGLSKMMSAVSGFAFLFFLGLLAYFLTLEYPKGLIQNYVFDYGLDTLLWR